MEAGSVIAKLFPSLSTRPSGATTLSAVEAHFARRLDGMATYDAFMDFSLVLYVQVLDGYIVDFETSGIDYLLLKWKDNKDIKYNKFFSFMVATTNSEYSISPFPSASTLANISST